MATPARRCTNGYSHLMLPSLVLGIVNSALIIRFTRATMLDVLERGLRPHRAIKGRVGTPRCAAATRLATHWCRSSPCRPDGGVAGRRRDRHRDGIRTSWLGIWWCRHGAAAGLSRHPGRADRRRGRSTSHQPRRRPHLYAGRSAHAVLIMEKSPDPSVLSAACSPQARARRGAVLLLCVAAGAYSPVGITVQPDAIGSAAG